MRLALLVPVALWAAMLASPGLAEASPRVRMTVRTTCPSPLQLEVAFAGESIALAREAPVGWYVRVAAAADGAILHMVRADGTARQERRIRSTDCRAVAEAFALIAAAHMRAATTPPPPTQRAALHTDSASGSTAPRHDQRTTAVERRAPPPGASPVLSAASEPAVAWAVGYQSGFDSTLSPDTSGRFDRVHIAVARHDAWGALLALRWTGSRSLAMNASPYLMRDEASAFVQLTRTMTRDHLWLTPAVGGGVAFSSVAHTSAGSVARMHPTINGSVAAGVRLTQWFSLRGEVGAQVFPVADTYRSSDGGAVGASPRATLSLGVGIQIHQKGW